MRLNPATLASLRFALGLSQNELAKRSGVGQGFISQIERGERGASPATVKKLAEAMGVSITALITDPTSVAS